MKLDINTLVGQLAAERDIEPEKLVDAIAEAISSAARKQYKDRGVHTEIDPVTGEVESWRIRMVVEEVEDHGPMMMIPGGSFLFGESQEEVNVAPFFIDTGHPPAAWVHSLYDWLRDRGENPVYATVEQMALEEGRLLTAEDAMGAE